MVSSVLTLICKHFKLAKFLPLLRLKFPAKILFLTPRCTEKQNGSSVSSLGFLMLCRTNCKLIVSEASSLISLWDYGKRLVYIDFSFSKGVTRYRFKGQTGPQCRSHLKVSLGFEKINCSFGSEKLPSSAGGSIFLQLLACKRDGGGKTSEVVSIWCS